MNRRDHRFVSTLWATALITAILLAESAARADELLAHGTAEMFWVARVSVSPPTGPGKPPGEQTIIRGRSVGGPGQWGTVGRLGSRAIALAHRGTQVAALLENGDWMLLWPNGATVGAPPDDGARLLTLTSDANTIWSIGAGGRIGPTTTSPTAATTVPSGTSGGSDTRAAGPQPRGELALYKLERGRWRRQAWLPPEITSVDASRLTMALLESTPFIAILQPGGSISTLRWTEGRWEELEAIDAADARQIRLLGDEQRALLWSAPESGAGRVYALTSRGWAEPRSLDMSDPPAAGEPRTIARAGNNLRLLFIRERQIFEQTFTDDGATLGSNAIPLPPAAPQSTFTPSPILTLAAAAMLMIVVMGALRRGGGAASASVAAEAGLRLAPLLFRFVAGVLDAMPLVIPCWFVFKDIDPNTADLEQLIATTTWPFYAALGTYLLYTCLSEAIFGRTLGKLLFGLRVVSLDGARPSFGAVFARNALRLVDVAMLGIPLVLVLLSPLRQRVGDIAARTVVVSGKAVRRHTPDDGHESR